MTLDPNKVAEFMSGVVATASILHAALPPISVFQDYPKFQRGYKFFVFLVGVIAINWRTEQQNVPSQPSSTLAPNQQVVPTTTSDKPNIVLVAEPPTPLPATTSTSTRTLKY